MSRLGQHDGDGIRYAMHLSAPKGGSAQMLRDPAGGWVSWEDYARLKAEVERLKELNATLWKAFWFGFGFACFLFFLFILGIFIIFWKKTLP